MSSSLKALVGSAAIAAVQSSNAAYVCSVCVLGLGLVEQTSLQIDLISSLKTKCEGNKFCEVAAQDLVLGLEAKLRPEDLCSDIGLCTKDCPVFDAWPVTPLPPQPPVWPTERKQ